MGVTIATVQTTCDTSTPNGTTQDITTADLGGLTPKAALFFISGATTLDSAATDARFGYGAADGTNEWSLAVSSEDNVATTDTYRQSESTECIQILNASDGTVDGEANFSSFIANGVRVNWGNYPGSAYYITVVLFAGTDVSAYVGSFTSHGTVNNATTVSGVGFEADVVLGGWITQTSANEGTVASHARLSLGACINDGSDTQACTSVQFQDGQGTSASSLVLYDHYVCSYLNSYGIEIDNFGADGFDAYTRIGGIAREVYFLALNFNSVITTGLDILTTPTSTGNEAFTVTLSDETPQLCLMGMSQAAAVDTLYSDSTAGTLGVYVTDADDEASHAVQDEDGQGTSDTQSYAAAKAVLDADDGTGLFDASFVSFAANTVTLNFAETDGTARKWWCLSFGSAAEAARIPRYGFTMYQTPAIV